MIRAIVFDYDGVIRDIDIQKTKAVARQYNMEFNELMDMLWSKEISYHLISGKISREEWWSTIQTQEELLQDLPMTIVWDELFAYPVFNQKLLEYIQSINDTYITAIFSNADLKSVELIRDQMADNGFDHIFASSEFGVAKPKPEAFDLLLDKLDIRADECLFFDDSPKNVAAAKEMGIHSYLYHDFDQVKSLVDSL